MLRFMFEDHKSSHDKLLMKPVTFDESKVHGLSTEVSQICYLFKENMNRNTRERFIIYPNSPKNIPQRK